MTYDETITIEHGLHTFVQGTVNHCPDWLSGLLNQLEKLGWNVELKAVSDMEMIRIIICDQIVYHRRDFLQKADFNTDGGMDPIVEDAVTEVQKATSIMEIQNS